MIYTPIIIGGAAIGCALGLLGRYHYNKVRSDYARGYNLGYDLGYSLGKSVYSKDDENVFTIDIRKDYNFKFGNHLWDAQQIQSVATHCGIDIFFKRDEFLKLVISHGKYNQAHHQFLLKKSFSDELNECEFVRFMNTYLEIENGKQTTTKED